MTESERLVASFTAMTPWARDKLLRTAESYSRNWPAKRVRQLELVPGPGATAHGEPRETPVLRVIEGG